MRTCKCGRMAASSMRARSTISRRVSVVICPPHWSGPKKSWRIKFGRMPVEHNGEVTEEQIYFQGKRQINLIIPV